MRVQRIFNVVQCVVDFLCQRFALQTGNDVLIITFGKVTASAKGLPEQDRRYVDLCIASHTYFD